MLVFQGGESRQLKQLDVDCVWELARAGSLLESVVGWKQAWRRHQRSFYKRGGVAHWATILQREHHLDAPRLNTPPLLVALLPSEC
jgi:hypothetical protein